MVSASISRSRKKSQLGPLFRASSQCATGSRPTAVPPPVAASRAHAPLSAWTRAPGRSEEHTSELQSQSNLVCRLLLEKKKNATNSPPSLIVAQRVHTAHSDLPARR